MENLITKSISYLEIRKSLNENENEIQNFINSIQSPAVKERVIDEAKAFYAKHFKTNKEDIWYGDISIRFPECKDPFPFSHVIGSIDLGSASINMDKLVYCINISSTGVQRFPNLKHIENTGNFNGTSVKTSYLCSLPKLEHAQNLYCANSNLKELPLLENAVKVNLTKSKMETINLVCVEEELSIAFSPIFDISSLKKVKKLNCRNTNVKYINPELEISGELICENSNGFEDKLKNNNVIL